jgi:hypothetical protein
MKYEKFFREFLGRDIPEHPRTEVQIVCPFHPDTQPSLRINMASGKWKCSGCKQAGSAVHCLETVREGRLRRGVGLLLSSAVPSVCLIRAREQVGIYLESPVGAFWARTAPNEPQSVTKPRARGVC